MVKWIKENLGKNIVLHISKYYPAYKLSIKPTAVEKMLELNKIASEYLNHVFVGNVVLPEGNNSYCPNCNKILINRNGYFTRLHSLNKNGNCTNCGIHVFNHLN